MTSLLKNLIKKNRFAMGLYWELKRNYFKYFKSDITLVKSIFKKGTGRELNLKNPVFYNDKLQWLKLYWRDEIAEKCADKYEVRKEIKEMTGLDKYLNEIYGSYESVEEIDLNSLPESFVLKGTHGSGFNTICKDKSMTDWNQEYKKMRKWLRTNYYWQNREWVYRDITPRIIAEKFLTDSSGKPPMDYKIFCFHGEPKLIQVDIDRFGEHKQNFYDTEWNFKDIEIWCDNDTSYVLEKPIGFDEMLDVSRILSRPFPHVRVDLYNIEGKIIFGELTFFHLSGTQKFRNEELEKEMGSWIKLENINRDGTYHLL
jgi:hypothetical protein